MPKTLLKKLKGLFRRNKKILIIIAVVFVLLTGLYLLAPKTKSMDHSVPYQNVRTTIPENKHVDFRLDPGNPVECGTTCRETTATIKNTGDETAHSVCVTLEVYNGNGELIFINGRSSFQRCIGDLSGGQSKSETVRIEADCGFLFSKCLAKPFTLKSKVTSNERTVVFLNKQFS